MSNEILLELFNDVLVPTIMQIKFDGQTSDGVFTTDICIYLLKIADKIINICQGDVQLNNEFLTVIFKEITKKSKNGTVNLAVQNLWQSLTKNVFSNYAGKDFKNINIWIFDRISNFKDKPDEAGEYEFTQLNVIFDLITLLAKENKH